MKKLFFILCILISIVSFSQQHSSKKFNTASKNIEIDTNGLDEIILVTSEDDFISIVLNIEDPFAHHIFTSDENGFLKISFQPEIVEKEIIFRKFITERLHRASVKIKIPKGKQITFLGKEIDIISKSYVGDIIAFIDSGTLNFNTIRGNLQLILSSGNISGITTEGNVNVASVKGKITIDNKIVQTPFEKKGKKSERKLVIKSIIANIMLTSK